MKKNTNSLQGDKNHRDQTTLNPSKIRIPTQLLFAHLLGILIVALFAWPIIASHSFSYLMDLTIWLEHAQALVVVLVLMFTLLMTMLVWLQPVRGSRRRKSVRIIEILTGVTISYGILNTLAITALIDLLDDYNSNVGAIVLILFLSISNSFLVAALLDLVEMPLLAVRRLQLEQISNLRDEESLIRGILYLYSSQDDENKKWAPPQCKFMFNTFRKNKQHYTFTAQKYDIENLNETDATQSKFAKPFSVIVLALTLNSVAPLLGFSLSIFLLDPDFHMKAIILYAICFTGITGIILSTFALTHSSFYEQTRIFVTLLKISVLLFLIMTSLSMIFSFPAPGFLAFPIVNLYVVAYRYLCLPSKVWASAHYSRLQQIKREVPRLKALMKYESSRRRREILDGVLSLLVRPRS